MSLLRASTPERHGDEAPPQVLLVVLRWSKVLDEGLAVPAFPPLEHGEVGACLVLHRVPHPHAKSLSGYVRTQPPARRRGPQAVRPVTWNSTTPQGAPRAAIAATAEHPEGPDFDFLVKRHDRGVYKALCGGETPAKHRPGPRCRRGRASDGVRLR